MSSTLVLAGPREVVAMSTKLCYAVTNSRQRLPPRYGVSRDTDVDGLVWPSSIGVTRPPGNGLTKKRHDRLTNARSNPDTKHMTSKIANGKTREKSSSYHKFSSRGSPRTMQPDTILIASGCIVQKSLDSLGFAIYAMRTNIIFFSMVNS